LGAGLTIQPRKNVIVFKNHKRGGQDPNWALKPYFGETEAYRVALKQHYISIGTEAFHTVRVSYDLRQSVPDVTKMHKVTRHKHNQNKEL
jgi:hypothetical protein